MAVATPLTPGLVRTPLIGPATGVVPYQAAALRRAPQPYLRKTFLQPGTVGTISAAIQASTYPPRIAVTMGSLIAAGAQTITVYRLVAGVRTLVRGGSITWDGINDNVLVLDAETPYGIPVRYVAQFTDPLGNVNEATSLPVTPIILLPVLTDAITGEAAEVTISAWAEKTHNRQNSTFNVNGRTVVVSGPMTTASSTIEFMTQYDSSRENLLDLLGGATSGIVQLRSPYGYSVDDAYLAVSTITERRFSQDGTDQRRLWSLDVIEVEAWPSGFIAQGYTLADLNTKYPGSLSDIAAAYSTLVQLASADLGL